MKTALRQRPVNAALLLAAALFTSAGASADDVYLKGGGRVSGRIVQKTETSVEIEVGAGKIAVPASRVEKIVEGKSSLDAYHERAGTLDPKDRDGWVALGRWASDQGLSSQAREAYHRVLAIDPNDRQANAALGNVQIGGSWVAEEEAYRARGFVQFEGEWMTPAEQAAIQRERDSERAQAAGAARARQEQAQAADAAEQAEARAKAEAAAQESQQGQPLWWGWGPGPVLWPTQPVVPAHPIVRNPR